MKTANNFLLASLLILLASATAQPQSQSQSQSQSSSSVIISGGNQSSSQSQNQSQTQSGGGEQSQSQSQSSGDSNSGESRSSRQSQIQSQGQDARARRRGNVPASDEAINGSVELNQKQGIEPGIADLSQQIAKEMTENQKRTIAVMAFVDINGRVTDFGHFLEEELVTHLHRTRKFRLIERQLLDEVIAEQKLSLTGILDTTSAKRLGRILGADAIVSGTITNLYNSVKVNARLINTETGEIFAAASTEIIKDQSVIELMGGNQQPGGRDNQGRTQAANSIIPAVDAKGITFELKQCRKAGGAITCDLLLTSNDRERELWLSTYESTGPSSLFDDAGNEAAVAYVRLGNKDGEQVHSTLVAGVAVKAMLRFEGISPQAEKIALLKIKGFIAGGPRVEAEFRNIPIGK
jgi:curli biogenesis system outer membrane secretion channel CsgG